MNRSDVRSPSDAFEFPKSPTSSSSHQYSIDMIIGLHSGTERNDGRILSAG
jgi:hypothetical protein